MVYLSFSIKKQVSLVVKGEQDMTVFADMESLEKNFDPTQFSTYIDNEYKDIIDMISTLSDEQLNTNISLFGLTQTR